MQYAKTNKVSKTHAEYEDLQIHNNEQFIPFFNKLNYLVIILQYPENVLKNALLSKLPLRLRDAYNNFRFIGGSLIELSKFLYIKDVD